MFSRDKLHLSVAIFGLLFISGCSNVEQRVDHTPQIAGQIDQPVQEDGVLDGLLAEAEIYRSPQKEHYLLRAAYDAYYEDDYILATDILTLIKGEISEMGLLIRRQLLIALLAEQRGEPEQVLEALQPFEGIPLGDARQAKQLHQLRIYAYQQLKMPQQEAEARVGVMAYLNDDEARLDNFQQLLDLTLHLYQLSEEETSLEQKALLQQQLGQLSEVLEEWRYRYSQHMEELPSEALPDVMANLSKPSNIAVLLPLTGRYASAAEVVRNGMLSAYFSHTGEPITLTFYDTQGNASVAWRRYHQAMAEGAEVVVGPLTKDAVNLFASVHRLNVPVLALNRSSEINQHNNGLYQFALSPENEATQTAIHAWNKGLRRPILLVPESNWGKRIQAAFVESWQLLGGEIASEQFYNSKQSDFSKPIRAALELDLSDKRLKGLKTVLRQPIKSTPRRRQDVDFIFIAAQPRQARLLKPQLKFHYAGDLPVYSTSHAYGGKPSPQQDHDMDGIIFGDTPWTLEHDVSHPLRQKILEAWPRADEKLWRLYAMGIDALALTRYIQARPTTLNYYGETGLLQLNYGGQLYRQLQWATFRRGVPVPLKPY